MTVTLTVSRDSGRVTYLGFAAGILSFCRWFNATKLWGCVTPAMMCSLAWYVTMACSGGKSIRQQRLWEGLAEEGLDGFVNGLQWSAGLCKRVLGSAMVCNRVLLLAVPY